MLLDVESGAVHVIDKLVFDIVQSLQTGGRTAVFENLAQKYPISELNEALDELDELVSAGELFAPEPVVTAKVGPQVVKAMCLHVAHDCNLRCTYCFASTGEYQTGRALMTFETGKKALDFLIERSGSRKNLEVDFFGGEPLLNFEVVKALVAYGREKEKMSGKTFKFTITTNGLGITDEIIDYCNREMSNVVISIDGRKEVHDHLRKTVGGHGSFDAILPKAKKFAFSRQELGKDYYIRGTFTRRNCDFVKDALFLADEGFEQISLEPVVLDASSSLSLREEDLFAISAEYERFANEYYERRKNGKWFNFFHFMIDLNHGPCVAKRMMGCGAGSEYVAVTPEGDIYPCHQFVGNVQFIMGSVHTGEFNNDIQSKFKACNITTKPACRKCWAKYYCSGGCTANAWNFNKDIYQPYTLSCDMQKKRFECALSIYAKERSDKIKT